MPPLPKKKHTRARKGGRAAHHFLTPANLAKCSSCGAATLPHRACTECGHYGPAGAGRFVTAQPEPAAAKPEAPREGNPSRPG